VDRLEGDAFTYHLYKREKYSLKGIYSYPEYEVNLKNAIKCLKLLILVGIECDKQYFDNFITECVHPEVNLLNLTLPPNVEIINGSYLLIYSQISPS
jgi:hypothetical protein